MTPKKTKTTDEKIADLREDVDNLIATMGEIVPILDKLTDIADNLANIDALQGIRLNMVENKDSNSRVLD